MICNEIGCGPDREVAEATRRTLSPRGDDRPAPALPAEDPRLSLPRRVFGLVLSALVVPIIWAAIVILAVIVLLEGPTRRKAARGRGRHHNDPEIAPCPDPEIATLSATAPGPPGGGLNEAGFRGSGQDAGAAPSCSSRSMLRRWRTTGTKVLPPNK